MTHQQGTEAPVYRRPSKVFAYAIAGALACAGFVGLRAPASADSFSHIPSIDLYPTANWAVGGDEYGSPGGPDPCNNYTLPATICPNGSVGPNAGNAAGNTVQGRIDLNAVISVPLVKGLAFQYEHDRAAGIDTTIGRVTGSTVIAGHIAPTHAYIYPATSNDIVDTFRLSYTGIRYVGLTAGSFYRFRHMNEATNDPLNLAPADWHEQFVTLSLTSPPITALNGFTVGVSATGVHNKHHVSGNPNVSPFAPQNIGTGLYNAAVAGYSDKDGSDRYGVNYGVNANLPVNHGFAVFGSASYGAFDWFDNSPVPFYYNIIDVGVFKKFNNVVSLTADLNHLTQFNLGNVPFVSPETIHRIYFAIAADVHVGR